jgi:hypothetical protein
MEKRQKILLGLLGLTILVALYVQFGMGGPGAKPGEANATGTAGMLAAKQAADQAKLTPLEAYKLEILAANATANPFYDGRGSLTAEDDQGGGKGEGPVYSGFIQSGRRVFAVIDGIEYAAGDQLADESYRVKSIERSLVVLERTDGSTGRKFTKRVSLVENDADKIRIRVVKKR